MTPSLRSLVEWSVRTAFRVDVYPDAFERLAIADRGSRLGAMFQHKIPGALRSHPLLFIHIPKNGGTSIKRSLYPFDPGHASARYYDWIDPSLRAGRTSFAQLREPVDRFLSGFDFLMNGGGSDVTIQPAALRRLAGIRSIDHYLERLESIAGHWLKVDSFARPQWWYVTDRSGAVAVDHLWLLGRQEAEMNANLSRFGVSPTGHANRTERRSHELTAAQRARVERLYRPDFALYEAVLRAPGAGRAQLADIVVPQL